MTPAAPRLDLRVEAPAAVVAELVERGVASRIAAGDATLWPAHARPGWVGAARAARPVGGEIEALSDTFRTAGTTRVIVAGDVGPAMAALAGDAPRLIVLDTPDPVRVADALAGDLETSVLVAVGSDPATEAVTRAVQRALVAEGLDAGVHTVRVGTGPVAAGPAALEGAAPGGIADPTGLVPDVGLVLSGLTDAGTDAGADPGADPGAGGAAAVVVPAPDDVAGPWAALTARALVPVGLAGTDVRALLADAAAALSALVDDDRDNPALVLGALLAQARTVSLSGPGAVDWVAQLLAGLGPSGPLPVVGRAGPAAAAPLRVRVEGVESAGHGARPDAHPDAHRDVDVVTGGPAAAQVLLWQHAVAVAAHLLGVDPTGGGPAPDRPGGVHHAFSENGVDAAAGDWLTSSTVADALRQLADTVGGHLAVQAWLDRDSDASAAVLAAEIGRRTGLTSTFGWAPAGPPGTGPVLLLTGGTEGIDDVVDPGLAVLQRELAAAQATALARAGRPVLALHLNDRLAGLVAVAHAVQAL